MNTFGEHSFCCRVYPPGWHSDGGNRVLYSNGETTITIYRDGYLWVESVESGYDLGQILDKFPVERKLDPTPPNAYVPYYTLGRGWGWIRKDRFVTALLIWILSIAAARSRLEKYRAGLTIPPLRWR